MTADRLSWMLVRWVAPALGAVGTFVAAAGGSVRSIAIWLAATLAASSAGTTARWWARRRPLDYPGVRVPLSNGHRLYRRRRPDPQPDDPPRRWHLVRDRNTAGHPVGWYVATPRTVTTVYNTWLTSRRHGGPT